MAKVFIEETTLTAIGDAIRGKTGKTDLIDLANMSTEIASIEAGGGGGELPEGAFLITGNANHKFAYSSWNWFLETYGSKITTKDISSLSSMFQNNTGLTKVPFQINITNASSFGLLFNGAMYLAVCPKIRGSIQWTSNTNFSDSLTNIYWLRDLEDLFEPEMFDGFSTLKITSAYSTPVLMKFSNMYSLRRLPSWWYKLRLNPASSAFPYSSYTLYNSEFSGCAVLDEAKNIPVWYCAGPQTSNMFSSIVSYCHRIKTFTFETNADGSPIETQWKSQTLDFSSGLGYSTSTLDTQLVSYNSGITADKRVKDDATYQALKNDPDWYTCNVAYSRYNHDSAVETINSLPDTSVYLASAGGTNTIKFKGASGSATDGGAINTLTEEEIAIATAKGWTVTLS